jgi:hypothetical protein
MGYGGTILIPRLPHGKVYELEVRINILAVCLVRDRMTEARAECVARVSSITKPFMILSRK